MEELDAKSLLADQLSTDHISDNQSPTSEYDESPKNLSKAQKKKLFSSSNCQLYDNLKLNFSEKNGYLALDNIKLPLKYDVEKSIECDTNVGLIEHKVQDGSLHEKEQTFGILDGSSRKEFMKKIYTVLLIHFIILIGMNSIFIFLTPLKIWIAEINIMAMISCCLLIEIFFIILLIQKSYRIWQKSILIFTLFILTESFLLGYITVEYDTLVIFMGIGLTIGVCIALLLFTIQKDCYVTVYRSAVVTLFVILVEIVIINMLLDPPTLILILSALSTIIYSFYMIYDIQLMVNGKHEYFINPEEYIFAALILNINIINIPLHISRILNGNKIQQRKSPPIASNKEIVI